MLFLADEPLSTRKVAQLANLSDGTEVRTLAKQLQAKYVESGQSLEVVFVSGGIQLRTTSTVAPWLEKTLGVTAAAALSPPALETLAIVAHRQPVERAQVEAIRGVGCSEILRQLLQDGLLRIVGRSPELGRPRLYGTTKRFLEIFGLNSLDELPRADQLARLDQWERLNSTAEASSRGGGEEGSQDSE